MFYVWLAKSERKMEVRNMLNEDENYQKGLRVSVRKNRFDSQSEMKVCVILNRILKDYGLEFSMQLRLTPQQALDNYVEVTDEAYRDYYKNKFKWMKFDFIFEQVYEDKDKKSGMPRMNYIPVAVVEYDGPYHEDEEQKKRDSYKNGVAVNIGAGMLRIKYDDLRELNEEELRNKYEKDILLEIIKGYFTKTVAYRKETHLINDNNEAKFKWLQNWYIRESKKMNSKKQYYDKFLPLLQAQKELLEFP